MFLEKLEIQGFKSFANKNVLKFSAADKGGVKLQKTEDCLRGKLGITAVVGPNGSGKSNIADAVRWVLGEQSVKLLRGKKSEDVIFSGSSKRSALSFTEVSLYLNNSGRAPRKDNPIEYSEVVVTRRLYRDGASEYLLNGARVRLLDISLLLAKAHFGQRAYSVIGQGMVENFLNTTMAERKEFFDEATGVKVFQIKRDDAMNKLGSARDNLAQAGGLLAEIEPRMRSLTRQMKRLEQRTEIEGRLRELQKNFYAAQWHQLNNELKAVNKNLLAKEQVIRVKEKEINKISEELEKMRWRQPGQDESRVCEEKKKQLEKERNDLFQKISDIKAQINISYEASGQTDAAWLNRRAAQLTQGQAEEKHSIADFERQKKEGELKVAEIKSERERLNKIVLELRSRETGGQHNDLRELPTRLKQYVAELIKIHQDIMLSLERPDGTEEARRHLKILKEKLSFLQAELAEDKKTALSEKKSAQAEIVKIEQEQQILIEQYIELQGNVRGWEAKIKAAKMSLAEKEQEQSDIKRKLEQSGKNPPAQNALKKQLDELDASLLKIKIAEEKIDVRLASLQEEGRRERDKMFQQQQIVHNLQTEMNVDSAAAGQLRIEKARLETKLEDLEGEIRAELENVRLIIDMREVDLNLDREAAAAEISKLKHQLELIGGIDPEVQKEYTETKVRCDFLTGQTGDLESGIASLEKVVAELDKDIAAKFDKSFSDIASNFEKYFKILFNGGSAKLVKIMEDPKDLEEKEQGDSEPAESLADIQAGKDEKIQQKNKIVLRQARQVLTGIEIQATPPGKKIKSISMLSGGERALTAIALICAIISVNPSPFVVLDEVDAALDEANSARLGNILEELAHKTQFIVITHNRSLMYKANIIYGIAMGADGVSQLLSLKVGEAAAGSEK